MSFVHLHVHSQYSLLNGTMDPARIASLASEMGHAAVGLTDVGNLYGGVAFYKACKGAGVKPILGCELWVQPDGIDDKREEEAYQVACLVLDQQGYLNLCQLITDGIFDGMNYKPRVDLARIAAYSEGLVWLTGGFKGLLGPLSQGRSVDEVRPRLERFLAAAGAERTYVELCDVGIDGQRQQVDGSRALAKELGLPCVVTNAVHYEQPEDAAVHEVLNAIAFGVSLTDARRLIAPTDQAYFKTEAELRALFPDDDEAFENTGRIAEQVTFEYDFDTYHFPATTPPDHVAEGEQPDTDANWEYFYRAFPPPRSYGLPDPEVAIPPRPEGAGNMNGYFRWYSVRGLELRLEKIQTDDPKEYWDRLDVELGIIEHMGFPAYLLIVAEFINWSKDNDIPVGPGRGSAAGSLVAYAMNITDIDPIRFGLLFERFLNPERVSMPDIDVDFCQDRREEAIEHVREKYGAPLVSQIITYGKLKAKAAVRDVARVLDLNFGEADRIAKLIPDVKYLKECIDPTHENYSEQLDILRRGDPKVRRVMDLALRVEGLCRQTGVHAAGVVIADKPLVNYAPLYRDEPEGGPVVQYDMSSAEGIGLIKFDFLGLKTLDQIRDAVKMIERNHGVALDMSVIDVDDQPTYEMLGQGDALGVFQLESSGMRELLTRLMPSCLDDMVALVALYRPGPLSSGMVDDFVDRKHGRQQVEYPHPMLEELLKPTYGTIVYQEQVMQIAQIMANYTLGGADLLRRAMGKKKASVMDMQRGIFVKGAVENDVPAEKAEEIFDLLAMFAAYGFNKSHSAAYGYVSYQTAWLKAHYRPEYMAALMSIEANNTDKVLMYIGDCRAANIDVMPVCVNESQRAFDAPHWEPGGEQRIRFGLAAVKNVGTNAIEAILEARQGCGGRFATLMEFFENIDYRRVNKRVVENLVRAGAFDCFGTPRAALIAGLDDAMRAGMKARDAKNSGQVSLFGGLAPAASPSLRWPDVSEWPLARKLEEEREVLGLYLTGHPMEAHEDAVERYANARVSGVGQLADGDEVRVVGVVSAMRVVRTKRGDKMAFVTLQDTEGQVEVTFFSDPYQRSAKALSEGEPILVQGSVEYRGEALQIRAESATLLSVVRERRTTEVSFALSVDDLQGARLETFLGLLRGSQGMCRTRVCLTREGAYRTWLDLPDELRVTPDNALLEGCETLFRRSDVVRLV